MYRSPSIELQAPTSPTHQLVLVGAKTDLPQAFSKGIPAHLKDHPALKGERGAILVLQGLTALIVLGIGKIKDFDEREAAEWGENAGHALNRELIGEVQVTFPIELKDREVAFNFLKGLGMANYRFKENFKEYFKDLGGSPKSKDGAKKTELKRVFVPKAPGIEKTDVATLAALNSAIAFARDIVELPPAYADPQGIVRLFEAAADRGRIEIEVWDEKRIRKEGMGLLQAVSQGSDTPPRFLIARYGKDLKNKGSLFLVGKGVTFDTGGVNLKTGSWTDLLWMKKDMGGAAAVLGALLAISRIRPGIQVTAITPLTTNSIGSKAVLPGDVVKSYSGKTVEIMNTDAEGRLVLGDAIHYAVQNKAQYIVNVATLTGACAVALGTHHTGLFTNNDKLGEQVLAASVASGEPAWKMPTSARYGEELKSKVADFANMGKTREGGAVVAAKFLERFVGNTPWVHLDIAGSIDLGEPAASGATVPAAGRMVHTLTTLAMRLAR